LPLYNIVHNILTNPVYAGTVCLRASVKGGRKRIRRGVRPLAEWDVLLKDQHEGYISWAEFERNVRKMYVAYGSKAGRYFATVLSSTTAPSAASGSAACASMIPSARVLRVLKPLGIDAAVKALGAQAGETSAAKRSGRSRQSSGCRRTRIGRQRTSPLIFVKAK
jgi:hypothetical protein